ncbi:hypothetical protein [Natrinema sp. DC36]|uniref:hypothetical protein n=1 Tax=Natrinema sp. DC36 TaxID=2878680 RepID=UPI001CF07094|nr:hypothetical protein [Natrinema sp. DC36]
MPDNSLSAAPENSDIQEWQCPYCEQTRQSLRELREHITESAEGDHRGVDGLKPTRDIVAYGSGGDVVERIEGVSTEPADPIEEYDKREVIINAWLAGERDPDRRAVEAISGATQQYISKLLNDIESGEIPRETWVEAIDYGLKDELEERLDEYEPEEDTEGTMSAQTTATPEEIIEDSTKKDRILAAYRANPNADKNAVADALGVSYEYVRQIYKDIDDRDFTEMQKLQEGEVNKELDEELEAAVEQRLRDAGALAGTSEEQIEDVPRESMSSAQVEGMVPASEIADVRDKIELLLEQAEYTGDEDAEFVARKGAQWLNDLLEQAE